LNLTEILQQLRRDLAVLFHWPVQGRIIASFDSSLNGGRNDRIKLAVPEGMPITAAEDGVVSYAGNGFAGQGNLVLIRHSNGYSTVKRTPRNCW
jgi:murein DD-endopeptidase MepM/ murein hydrolase activator NlpD